MRRLLIELEALQFVTKGTQWSSTSITSRVDNLPSTYGPCLVPFLCFVLVEQQQLIMATEHWFSLKKVISVCASSL
jgi:hypothetical protein